MFLVIIGIALLVMAQVSYPSKFYGEVRIDGDPAPVGTLVRAEVDLIITNYYVESEGLYGIEVEGLAGGGSEDQTITFTVDGMGAGTGIFDSSTIQEKDLSVGSVNNCEGYCSWENKDPAHAPCGSPYEGCVCMYGGSSYYNKACCSGEVEGIITY